MGCQMLEAKAAAADESSGKPEDVKQARSLGFYHPFRTNPNLPEAVSVRPSIPMLCCGRKHPKREHSTLMVVSGPVGWGCDSVQVTFALPALDEKDEDAEDEANDGPYLNPFHLGQPSPHFPLSFC